MGIALWIIYSIYEKIVESRLEKGNAKSKEVFDVSEDELGKNENNQAINEDKNNEKVTRIIYIEKLNSFSTKIFIVFLSSLIPLFISFLIYIIAVFNVDNMNYSLKDVDVLYCEDEGNNLIVKGNYVAILERRKIHYSLNISLKNLNKKDLSFARVTDMNSNEKYDFTDIESGDKKSHIILKDVSDKDKYDIKIKDVVFEE